MLGRGAVKLSFGKSLGVALAAHVAVVPASRIFGNGSPAAGTSEERVFFTVSLTDAPQESRAAAINAAPDEEQTTAGEIAPAASPKPTVPSPKKPREHKEQEPAPVVNPAPIAAQESSQPAGVIPAATAQRHESSGSGEGTISASSTSATGVQGTGTGLGGGGVGGGVSGGSAAAHVLPFGPGMTRPSLISKIEPTYTREALASGVEGVMLVKCTITLEGALSGCRIVKSLPHMDTAVLAALSHWRYTPVTYQGHPVAVDYVIPVRLVLR